MDRETIAAIATPVGSGGIGIIRISGSDALTIADRIFTLRKACVGIESPENSSAPSTSPLESHRLYLGFVADPEDGNILDEVLLAIMRAPRSYTREDCVEIQAHAGTVVLHSILELVLRQGARLAKPGEFTLRAFLNGRIDLTQAEAVTDIINAKTDKALEIATTQVKGHFRETVEALRQIITDVLSEVEAGIDFPEEVGDSIDEDRLQRRIGGDVIEPLKDLLKHFREGQVLRNGLQMALIGRTNVGKSSLMNRLLRKNRVIVAEIPGTTRDAVDDVMNIRGLPVILTDTAGIRNPADTVERMGVERTRQIMSKAELVLFVIDASEPVTREEREILVELTDKSIILVLNKIDLVSGPAEVSLPDELKHIPRVETSALYNQGISTLKDRIAQAAVGNEQLESRNAFIPNLRHQVAIREAVSELETCCDAVRQGAPMELVAIHLREALASTGTIIGVTASEDILDSIFSKFCIGK